MDTIDMILIVDVLLLVIAVAISWVGIGVIIDNRKPRGAYQPTVDSTSTPPTKRAGYNINIDESLIKLRNQQVVYVLLRYIETHNTGFYYSASNGHYHYSKGSVSCNDMLIVRDDMLQVLCGVSPTNEYSKAFDLYVDGLTEIDGYAVITSAHEIDRLGELIYEAEMSANDKQQ